MVVHWRMVTKGKKKKIAYNWEQIIHIDINFEVKLEEHGYAAKKV